MKRVLFLVVIILMVTFAGCRTAPKKVAQELDFNRELAPGQLALRKITDPALIPDFTIASYDLYRLQEGVDSSLNYLSKPSSQAFFPYGDITHQHMIDSLDAFSVLLESGYYGQKLNKTIREKFDIYTSIGCDNRGAVLFTGYYTPILDGSLKQSSEYQYPLYKQPNDLVKGLNGEILGQRNADSSITKYPSRAEIEASQMLRGQELVWLRDPFEVYIAHVQGSAKIRLPDGKFINVGYAATNGHDYQSVSAKMIGDSKISKEKMSLSAMIEHFKRNPHEINSYTAHNPRYVFFRLSDTGPRGSLNEPVIPMRTIATDKTIYPRAGFAFMTTKLPVDTGGQMQQKQYSGFVLDQDTGGAIRAPGRCDVYMGQGEKAGKKAGHTYQQGRLYYLFLKK